MMFETLQKRVEDYYSDDGRYFIERHGGKLYFLQSNHHNAELFVVICDETPQLLAAIVAAEKEEEAKEWGGYGIIHVIYKTMMANGGIKLGDDDDLRDKRMMDKFAKYAAEMEKAGAVVTKIEPPPRNGYKFQDFYILTERCKS